MVANEQEMIVTYSRACARTHMYMRYAYARKIEMATAAVHVGPAVDVPNQPHQSLTFAFPKRSFGKKAPVFRSFQPSWFSQWPFLHYDEANDVAYCHTCLMGFKMKRMRTNTADPAFVSDTMIACDIL